MVEIEVLKGKSELGAYYEEHFIPFIKDLIGKVQDLRKKEYKVIIYPQINVEGDTPGILANHGNSIGYVNSKFVIRDLKATGWMNQVVGRFTISCFPNCCGKALITAGSHYYGSDRLDALMSIYFALIIAKRVNYASVTGIDIATSNNISTYQTANFTMIEESQRKSYHGSSLGDKLHMYTRHINSISEEALKEEMYKVLNIKEIKEEPKVVENGETSNNFLVHAREL